MKKSIRLFFCLVGGVCISNTSFVAHAAATDLADQPIAASSTVPGNLALPLSVEYPTAVSVAHTNRTYAPASEYLGYFDPAKCYDYRYSSGDSTTSPNTTNPDSYFYPVSLAGASGTPSTSTHICSGHWSGNFLNWASMQTIDTFRSVLTGGYRVIDMASLSVIEKAWASGQGGTGNFPDSTLDASKIAGATPFTATSNPLSMRIQGLGNKIRFALPQTTSTNISFLGNYYNNTAFTGTAALTRTDSTVNFNFNGGSPGPGVNATNIGIVWTSTFTAPYTGAYVFGVSADDTAKLTINNTVVINQTGYLNGNLQTSAAINFTAGDTITLRLEFTQGGGGSFMYLSWNTPISGSNNYSPIGAPITASLNTNNAASAYQGADIIGGTVYEAFIRAKVCDSSGNGSLLETNCTQYAVVTTSRRVCCSNIRRRFVTQSSVI